VTLGAGSAAGSSWRAYRDHTNGFAIETPASWVLVPGSSRLATRLALNLEKSGNRKRAALVRDASRGNFESSMGRAVLDGIQFPVQTTPILTDFMLSRNLLPVGVASDSATLKAIASEELGTLASTPGVRMLSPKSRLVTLGNIYARTFTGSIPAPKYGQGVRTGFEFFVLLGPGRALWQIEFRTSATHLSADIPLFERISHSLRLF
jgi:hypothetical protein